MFVVAHLSDPHLAPLPLPAAGELMSKRALGFLNWHWKRKRIHRRDILDLLIADMRRQSPDHVVVTGDLVNISSRAEFIQAQHWLADIGAPHDVTVVPGNHDAYVSSAVGVPERLWDRYMRSDGASAQGFPLLRRRGPIAFIGLSSAIPTAAFMATGNIGPAQLSRLAPLLAATTDYCRIVLVHHAPRRVNPLHKRLTDAAELCAVLADQGAEIVLSGHHHVSSEEWLAGAQAPIAAIGVPSASASSDGGHEPAAYHLYRIDGSRGAWRCERIRRGFAPGGQEVVELDRRSLLAPSS
jgi:3',5'-cyclic AMP phosphodiesterase CpdA